MKYIYLFFLFSFSQLIIAQGNDFSGLYTGTFKHGKFKTDVEFDIQATDEFYAIKFNSLSQNAFGIPAGDIKVENDTLKFALQSDYYRYDFSSTLNKNNELLTVLHVDGNSYDLKLKKENQTESATFKSKDIRFRSEGLLLYGTIYYPENHNGKAIYIVTSSGNQDRSGSRAEALLLAKAGYISFHIDKRGTGISDGNWEMSSIPELCADDLHALEFLHQSEKIDFADIGIKGSSQGGTKIPYILKEQPKLAFGIVVSCPASTLWESDLNYWKNRNAEVIGNADIADASELQGAVFQYIAEIISREDLEKKIEVNKSKTWFDKVWIPELDQVDFDKKLDYSPLPYFEHNTSPMLLIQGSKDEIIQLNSLEIIEKTIGKKGNKKNQYTELEGANHAMMQLDNTDFPYWQSLHPKYMDSMLKWIKTL
ncbi:prolyl oligopeptidase family serine peptidase [Lutimonas halocynthiae]|uniref:alpha/beta hydrolase family protein n=1 Tax=Lutimonas halocynthiae TaxID=1446477 RepID=UPI0025B52E16|nr:alpha/beta hydrolase [Lutimonas halocynthiae]MDN3643995.1 prolyl oligopeptidase family serine peptidase [Lutimonas halocynthiae]